LRGQGNRRYAHAENAPDVPDVGPLATAARRSARDVRRTLSQCFRRL